MEQQKKGLLQRIGPSIITGASDDDPAGIATYSQTGAKFGYGLLWLAPFTLPLMFAVQEMSARIAMVTGKGLMGVMRERLRQREKIQSRRKNLCTKPRRKTRGNQTLASKIENNTVGL